MMNAVDSFEPAAFSVERGLPLCSCNARRPGTRAVQEKKMTKPEKGDILYPRQSTHISDHRYTGRRGAAVSLPAYGKEEKP